MCSAQIEGAKKRGNFVAKEHIEPLVDYTVLAAEQILLLARVWENRERTKVPFVKFIFEFTAPDRLPTSAVPQRIPSLNHESFDYTMKYKIVIISIPAMGSEVLHSFWTLFWI